MDDTVDSRMEEETLTELSQGLVHLLKYAEMVAGKFCSNSKTALKSLPKESLAKEISLIGDKVEMSEGKVKIHLKRIFATYRARNKETVGRHTK